MYKWCHEASARGTRDTDRKVTTSWEIFEISRSRRFSEAGRINQGFRKIQEAEWLRFEQWALRKLPILFQLEIDISWNYVEFRLASWFLDFC